MSEPDDWEFDPPEGWEPDEYGDVDYYVEHERIIESRDPFTFRDQADRKTAASFYGDHQDLAFYARCRQQQLELDEDFWINAGLSDPLTHADLVALRALDAVSDCNEDDYDPDAGDGLSLSLEELQRLWAIGRRLHEREHSFWLRLRRLGPTPSLLATANELLVPHGVPSQPCDSARTATPAFRRRLDLGHSRGGGRRQRRSARRRAVRSSARSGDSGDGSGEGEPASRVAGGQADAGRPHVGRRPHEGGEALR